LKRRLDENKDSSLIQIISLGREITKEIKSLTDPGS